MSIPCKSLPDPCLSDHPLHPLPSLPDPCLDPCLSFTTGLLPDGQPGPDRQLAAVPGEHAGTAREVPQYVQVQYPVDELLDLYYPHIP